MSAVAASGLVVRFDALVAVDEVSLEVERGEVFGLLGPNGAGKTTTLRVLTTLLKPAAGSAVVAGFDVASDALAVRASIGYVPQALSADGGLTAAENLDFYARVTGVPRRERAARIAAAVEAMELEPMLDRLARTFSGGMLRRLEIATALLNRPDRCCSSTSRPWGSIRRRGRWCGSACTRCAPRRGRRSSSPRT